MPRTSVRARPARTSPSPSTRTTGPATSRSPIPTGTAGRWARTPGRAEPALVPGAAALDEAVGLAAAPLHVRVQLRLGLLAQPAGVLGGLAADRREHLLAGRARRDELPVRLVLGLAHDAAGGAARPPPGPPRPP